MELYEAHGETRGLMVAEEMTYGADKLWVILKAIQGSDASASPSTGGRDGSE